MEKIAEYLEKLGYEVEEQGRLAKYLVVTKNGIPIGFILSDYTVKLISGTESENGLVQVVDFVRQNSFLPSVGASEFLLASFCKHQMTTFFDTKEMRPQYCLYIFAADGQITRTLMYNHDSAIRAFVSQAGMLSLSEMKGPRISLGERLRMRLLRYLLNRSNSTVKQQG